MFGPSKRPSEEGILGLHTSCQKAFGRLQGGPLLVINGDNPRNPQKYGKKPSDPSL